MVTSRHILQPQEELWNRRQPLRCLSLRPDFNLHIRCWSNFFFLRLNCFETCSDFTLQIKYYESVTCVTVDRGPVHLTQSFWFLNFLLCFLLLSQRKPPGDKLTDNKSFPCCCTMNSSSSWGVLGIFLNGTSVMSVRFSKGGKAHTFVQTFKCITTYSALRICSNNLRPSWSHKITSGGPVWNSHGGEGRSHITQCCASQR